MHCFIMPGQLYVSVPALCTISAVPFVFVMATHSMKLFNEDTVVVVHACVAEDAISAFGKSVANSHVIGAAAVAASTAMQVLAFLENLHNAWRR